MDWLPTLLMLAGLATARSRFAKLEPLWLWYASSFLGISLLSAGAQMGDFGNLLYVAEGIVGVLETDPEL